MTISGKSAGNENLASPATDNYRLGYRADIEGLRAIAILLVVAAHAGVPWLQGGFVGVDVFFVLSGYLITGLLLQEKLSTGTIQLLKFYVRRLKRLLPALLFMVFCISLAVVVLLAPFEHLEQLDAARATALWISNLYFAFRNLDYFGPAAEKNLYLHTWSLGVEEQFYLIWPVFMMLLLGAYRWQGTTQNMRRLVYGLGVTIWVCLLLSVFLSNTKPQWGFYLMPSRAWQFALGALALLVSTRMGSNTNTISNLEITQRTRFPMMASGWIGLALILGAALFLRPDASYPGAWALIPSVGAVLVLIAGSTTSKTTASKLLSIQPMQWTGRLSYSWYLWHWPILVLGKTAFPNGDGTNVVVLVVLSLGLAGFSYWAIESPIRHNMRLSARPRLTLVASVILMTGTVVGGSIWHQAATAWANSPAQRVFAQVRLKPLIYELGCDEWFYTPRILICSFGDKNAKRTAVLIGDSMMGQWFPAVSAIYAKRGWRLLVITKSACPMVEASFIYQRIGKQYTVCDEWRKAVLKELGSIKPDVVITGSASPYSFSKDQWTSGKGTF